MMVRTNLELAKLVGDGVITLEEAQEMRDLRQARAVANAVGQLRDAGLKPSKRAIALTAQAIRNVRQ